MGTKKVSMNWYVAYTFPKAEQSVHRSLEKMKIVSFLPLHDVVRTWKDRIKKMSTPLFPNYIFIYSSHCERYDALQIKGIVRYISFDGKPAIIKDEQIESIKRIIAGDIEIYQKELLKPGNRVKIIHGPFLEAEGTLEKVNGNTRLVVKINWLNRSVLVNVSIKSVSPVY